MLSKWASNVSWLPIFPTAAWVEHASLLVAETLGGLADDFVSTIWDIGRSIGLRSGADGDKVTTKYRVSIIIALWRGNASMLIHRSPTLSPVLDGLTAYTYSTLLVLPLGVGVHIVCSYLHENLLHFG